MKKIYKLEGLCCANCAAKIEEGIKKLDGVGQATIAFMTQKLTMEVEEDKVVIVDLACKKVVNKIEPDVQMVKIK